MIQTKSFYLLLLMFIVYAGNCHFVLILSVCVVMFQLSHTLATWQERSNVHLSPENTVSVK